MFSWKPIYEELATNLLAYRDRQDELLAWLHEMKDEGVPVVKLGDENPKGTSVPLTEIDPFSFFANFNRGIKTAHRIRCLKILKEKMGLSSPVPSDFDGIPIVNLQKAMFFPFAYDREPHMVPTLWDFAEQMVAKSPSDADGDLFKRCLDIPQIGLAKLTMGMFWMRPDSYLAVDQVNISFLGEQGFDTKKLKVPDLSAYLGQVDAIKTKLGTDLPTISHNAYAASAELSIDAAALEAGFKALLERTAESNDVTVEALAQWMNTNEEDSGENEITNRVRRQKELGALLRSGTLTLETLKPAVANLWVLGGQSDTIRRNEYFKSDHVLDDIAALLDDGSGVPLMVRISDFIDAAFDHGYCPNKGEGRTEPAQFASALLSAYYPDRFVDFRKGRWNDLYREIFNNKKTILHGQNYGYLLLRAGSFAAALAKTPTFQKHFGGRPELWTAAGVAYMYKDGVFKVEGEVDAMKRYWAGGHLWGTEDGKGDSHLDEFIQGDLWRHGYGRDATSKPAIKTWEFFNTIAPGDEFAIKGYGGQGVLKVYYVGTVTEVLPDEATVKLNKLERKLFHGKAPSVGAGGSWFGTLTEVTGADAIQQVFHGKARVPLEEPELPDHPLNTVLYGPPGTGKTYQSTHMAVDLVEGESEVLTPEQQQERFDALLDGGRVEFITFHQSFAYEDFVEGIRPVLEKDGTDGTPRYECRDGVFKRIAVEALYAALQRPEAQTHEAEFEARWTELTNQIEESPDHEYEGLTEKTRYTLTVSAQGNISARNVVNPDASPYLCGRHSMKKVFVAHADREEISTRDVNKTLGVGNHAHLAVVIFRALMQIDVESAVHVTEARPVASYEERKQIALDYLEQREETGYRLMPLDQAPRFVLVVDEINRGNISKILGELVTLLEPDKRVGAGRQLRVTLPYSGEVFGVPQNLYIVGTMNTADKSIALVDVALRRRFEFLELMPDFGVCPTLPDDIRTVLGELNQRIALRKDRDHQIGHSYFMGISGAEEFNQQFAKTTVPLLQEYFYNDWDGLRFVLGEAQKEEGPLIRATNHGGQKWARNRWQWCFDAGTTDLDYLSILLANYKLNGETPTDDA